MLDGEEHGPNDDDWGVILLRLLAPICIARICVSASENFCA
jgi:hypothetical protein